MADSKTQIIISAKDETLQAFNKVRSGLLGIGSLAASIGVVGFAASIKSAADFADEIGKAAQKVGVTTEALSALKYAADLSDVSFESLQTGLKKLSVNMLTAAQGGKEAQEAFKLVGINVKDSAGNLKGADAVLAELADKFQSLPDGAQKTALAVKLLGKSGADLIPLLNGGSQALAAMAAEAEKFGLVVTADSARAAEQFNDNITRLEGSLQGLKLAISKDLLPGLAQISDAMAQAAKEGGLLHAVFVGLGGVATFALGLDDVSQASDKLQDVNREIADIQKQLSAGTKRTAAGVIGMDSKDVSELTGKLKALGLQAANLKSITNPSSVTPLKKNAPLIVDEEAAKAAKKLGDDAAKTAQKIYDQKLAFFKQSQEDLARIITSFKSAAEESDADPSAKLQAQLDSLRALDPAMQTYLQGLVDVTRQKELENRQSDLAADADERELAALEEQAAAQDAVLQQREEAFDSFYDNLIKGNEDLSISLISNDKKRAQAQIEIEHQRQIEFINGLGLTEEAAQKGLEASAAQFELRMEELEVTGKDGFASLKNEIEGFSKDAGDAITDFAFGAESDFEDMVSSFLKNMARLAIKRGLTDPLFEAFSSGGGSGFGEFFGSFFSGQGFASGGRPPLNKASLVGERGPELFVPDSAGTIIPNNFGGGGTSITVNVDASGNSNVQGDGNKAGEIGRQITAMMNDWAMKNKRPGGLLA
jgi:hypothetical protein